MRGLGSRSTLFALALLAGAAGASSSGEPLPERRLAVTSEAEPFTYLPVGRASALAAEPGSAPLELRTRTPRAGPALPSGAGPEGGREPASSAPIAGSGRSLVVRSGARLLGLPGTPANAPPVAGR